MAINNSVAQPVPGAPQFGRSAKNAASINRKANIRALAGKQGVNQGTVDQIAANQVTTAGEGAEKQQQFQIGQSAETLQDETKQQKIQQDTDTSRLKGTADTQLNEIKTILGSINRNTDAEIAEGRRQFATSEAKRGWGNNDTRRIAAAAESKTQADWEVQKQGMLDGYESIFKEIQRENKLAIRKLQQAQAKAEAENDRASVSRIMAEIARRKRAEERRKKNNNINKKYLGAAKIVAGVAIAVVGSYTGVGAPASLAAGGSLVTSGANDVSS